MPLRLKPLRVIVVDDSRAYCAGISSMLAGHVEQVTAFVSAKDALNSLATSVPDIIISDLEMPDMDGFEFIRALRSLPKVNDTPILVLTGREQASVMSGAILAGADAFAAKGSMRETLLPHLFALARVRDAHREAVKGKQLQAVKAMVGTYKHEFGNTLAVIEGKLNKLERTHPHLAEDESLQILKKWTARFAETLAKLDALSYYEETSYVEDTSILKTG